jgi:hypothetical protein
MTTNLRLSLTILTVGFAIEGGGELYSVLSGGRFQPGVNLLFLLPVVMTLAGLLFVWIGRHEWNEIHHARVRQAHVVFALTLLGAVIAAGVLAALVLRPSLGVPLWARGLFAAAIGSLVLGTFVTYALLVFHLVPRPSKALLLASLVWSLLVAGLVGAAISAHLSTIVALAEKRSATIPTFISPIDSLSSYLFVSYFLLFAAYLDAHRTVLQGGGDAGGGAVPPRPTPARAPGGPGSGA